MNYRNCITHSILVIFVFLVPLTTFGSGTITLTNVAPNPARIGELVTFSVDLDGHDCFVVDADGDMSKLQLVRTSDNLVVEATLTPGQTTTVTCPGNMAITPDSIHDMPIYTAIFGNNQHGDYTATYICANALCPSMLVLAGDRVPNVSAATATTTMLGGTTITILANAIPTMSQWGLIILSISLLIIGVGAITSRRRASKIVQ